MPSLHHIAGLPHYIAGLKIVAYAGGIVGAIIWALDPTIKVALIVSVPATIASVGTLILGFLNRSDAKRSLANQDLMKRSVDGINTRLEDKNRDLGVRLADKSEEAAHAAGRREGSEAERGKDQK